MQSQRIIDFIAGLRVAGDEKRVPTECGLRWPRQVSLLKVNLNARAWQLVGM